MINSYEVTLVLFSEVESPYNPVFVFEKESEATALMKIFIEQGHSSLIRVTYED